MCSLSYEYVCNLTRTLSYGIRLQMMREEKERARNRTRLMIQEQKERMIYAGLFMYLDYHRPRSSKCAESTFIATRSSIDRRSNHVFPRLIPSFYVTAYFFSSYLSLSTSDNFYFYRLSSCTHDVKDCEHYGGLSIRVWNSKWDY